MAFNELRFVELLQRFSEQHFKSSEPPPGKSKSESVHATEHFPE
jgi:hypothetical protein